ncbi:MAG: 4'-phosphopantetheinyl transferase superfamily protein [Paracoccaceae bacterium]|nr:4'-phosphopantetheinyl transferase superfamily protein [Paracoccaceae bacterium]
MTAGAIRDWMQAAELPLGLHWAVTEPDSDYRALFPAEKQAIARAVPSRKAEFTGGRRAARAALTALGHPSQPIPMAADRAPVWPEGVRGSITHCGQTCMALVSSHRDCAALGVDLEAATPLDDDLISEICHQSEAANGTDAKRVFSAKEAIYKAQYPLTGAFLGFDAVRVDLAAGLARFVDHPHVAGIAADLRDTVWPFSQWQVAGMILTLCHKPA